MQTPRHVSQSIYLNIIFKYYTKRYVNKKTQRIQFHVIRSMYKDVCTYLCVCLYYKVWNTRGKLYAVYKCIAFMYVCMYVCSTFFTIPNKNNFVFNTIIKNVHLSVNNGNYTLIYWTLYEYKWSLINIYNAGDTIYKTTIRITYTSTIHIRIIIIRKGYF